MAARMRAEDSDFSGSFVGQDLAVYDYARSVGNMSIMAKYADAMYDSSADFWKLTKDGNGNWKWIDDKSADFDISEALNDPEFKKNLDRFLGTGSANLQEALFLSQYNDGKKDGVISAERMNETIAYSLATSLVPFDFTPTRIIGGLEYKSDYRLQSDMNRGLFIESTFEKIQYNEYHTTTIRNDKNQPVTLWNIDSTNAKRITLLSQNDDIFSDIRGIASGGCNFMVILAAAQIMTGETLSAGQIKDIWENAVASKPAILSSNGTVGNRNALANMALSQLGRTDIAISMDGTFKSNKSDSALMGSRIKVPYNDDDDHYILGAKSSTALTVPVYNPGETGKKNKLFQFDAEIWVYAKKTR
jgi:hypothetical protein